MTETEISLLLRAAKAAGLDPNTLHPRNPWEFKGPTAELLQAAVTEIDPVASQRFQKEAGVGLSLAAEAVLAGIAPMTPSAFQELAAARPADLAAERSQFEADQLRGMEDAAAALAARNTAGPTAQELELEAMARADSMAWGRAQLAANGRGVW